MTTQDLNSPVNLIAQIVNEVIQTGENPSFTQANGVDDVGAIGDIIWTVEDSASPETLYLMGWIKPNPDNANHANFQPVKLPVYIGNEPGDFDSGYIQDVAKGFMYIMNQIQIVCAFLL